MQNLYRPHAQIILASGSPRRQELLARLGVPFDIRPADIEEIVDEDKLPHEVARSLAEDKASHVAKAFPQCAVIGSDTIVVSQGQILGKPKDYDDAMGMLRQLSGNWHEVVTGLSVQWGEHSITDHNVTRVHFATMSDEEIANYIKTGDPMDKAGAYGIQGLAGFYIDRIEGDYYNVMGLPLSKLLGMLRSIGVIS